MVPTVPLRGRSPAKSPRVWLLDIAGCCQELPLGASCSSLTGSSERSLLFPDGQWVVTLIRGPILTHLGEFSSISYGEEPEECLLCTGESWESWGELRAVLKWPHIPAWEAWGIPCLWAWHLLVIPLSPCDDSIVCVLAWISVSLGEPRLFPMFSFAEGQNGINLRGLSKHHHHRWQS